MVTMTKETFKPSSDMVHAAQAVFMCMAAVQTIKPIVQGYEKAILEKHQFPIAKKWAGKRDQDPNEVILDPEKSYLLEDFDFQTYLEECRVEQAKAGLKTEKPEFCPLLVAENNLRQAQNLLIETMEPLTGVKHEMLFRHGVEDYNKYVDLTLRLLAPFVKNPLKAA